MTAALSGELRSVLEGLVQSTRAWVEEDLAGSLEGRFGIHLSGRLEPVAELSLSATQLAVRADLIDIVEYLRAEGEGEASAVKRLVREAAFTQVNRLVAVRVAEAVGVLPETMGRGLSSSGFKDFSELAPLVATSEWGRFGVFVRMCADELARDVPALFDPRNPLLEVELSEPVLARVVQAIAAIGDEVWGAPDALGWTFQFFNTGEERIEMRDSSAPRTSRELAVRNQFFTPSYVVDFLIQNGLGTCLAAGIDGFAETLPFLLEEPTERHDIDLAAVSVLDPACGSGHFLLGAYNVLETAWEHRGVSPEDAAPAIVASLWGVDIDPRATQIAQAAVIFRARRHCRDADLPTPNVICARALPAGPEIDAFIAQLPSDLRRAVRAIADELVDAPVLGPLLKIEESIGREARNIFGTGEIEGTLSPVVEIDIEAFEVQALAALANIADSVTSTPAQRLFAAEAHDAVRFVEAMARRYTAVVMNPPFGEPVPETKPYLKTAYPWLPSNCDLGAAFVGRGLELSAKGYGSCAAVTNRTGMSARGAERWRRDILLASELSVLCDLGIGVMEQALVEAAAYVVRNRAPQSEGTFIRLTRDKDRSAALLTVCAQVRAGCSDDRVFRRNAASFEAIPYAPLAYWMDQGFAAASQEFPPLAETDQVKSGLKTGDDFRFARLFWEVEPSRIAHSSQDVAGGQSWVPLAKGGAYSPYWADIHLLVDWTGHGTRIRDTPGSGVSNTRFFFQHGLTWTERTASGFAPRLLPQGCIPGDKGPLIRAERGYSRLALLTSRFAKEWINVQLPGGDESTSSPTSKSYTVGIVGSVPDAELPHGCAEAIERMVRRRQAQDTRDEVTRSFVGPADSSASGHLEQLEDGLVVEELVSEAFGLSESVLAYLDNEAAPYPLRYPESTSRDDRIAELFTMPIKAVIKTLLNERGGSRAIAQKTFVADRRLEVIAHGLEVSPRSILRVVEERELVAPGASADAAFRMVSYLVGVGFGRWDIGIGIDPSLAVTTEDLLAPPARYSPGTLLDESGQPPPSTPADYPLAFPADGVLVDQPGHRWDLAAQVQTAAKELSGSLDDLDAALAVLMKKPSLDMFLRGQFFKEHSSMYSMSRRKAPIYWQLQVPSKGWGVWLYAPRLSREMLFAVVQGAAQRADLANNLIRDLQREAEAVDGGRSRAAVATELDAEQRLLVELGSFKTEAERIANLGWEPDLDDGMVLNAAPLAGLFPAWKEAAEYRQELRSGNYEWARVAQYADQI